MQENEDRFPCPCCNSLTLSGRGDYEICEVCGWEDDPVQSGDPTFAGGANQSSLNEARTRWQAKIGKAQ
ncbi:CPCC family cysteine-rich protein [Paraburkholderia sp.]|uniref:CPCC family cysteine-rich protein n=1 Tax=Paraburkholderia sp. TaxID=1926495 RepID=UPI00286EFCB1|nr:CPCC family cysteine-rich protein [Paraburkholderia sp.]